MGSGPGVIQQLATPSTIVTGINALNGTAEKLVAAVTPCKYVWIGAPADADGAATNTKPFWIGAADVDATAFNGIMIADDDFEGVQIAIDDASKIYVDGTNADDVVYAIFS